MSAADSENNTRPLSRFLVRGKTGTGRTDAVKAYGVRLPSGNVLIEWRRDAWPESNRLNGPHQSLYDSLADFRSVLAEDAIEWIDPETTKYGGRL
jgi:hypothetical protein